MRGKRFSILLFSLAESSLGNDTQSVTKAHSSKRVNKLPILHREEGKREGR